MSSSKQKNRDSILEVIKGSVSNFSIKGNVYYVGEKVFVVNSVVQWLVDKLDAGDFEKENADFYVDAINKYIRNEVNLRWDEDNLVIEGK